jgi:P pilus assembly chaperone PapD
MKKCTVKYRIRKYSLLWFAKALAPLALVVLLFGCMTSLEAEAEVITEPTPVEFNEVTEPVALEELYWPLTAE